MITRRSWFTYGTLLAIWLALLGWQVVEHQRVRHAVQLKLVEETKNISNTLGVFMRSQSFFGFISRRRLESALNELVKPGELHPLAVAVVNLDYERVASAGQSNQLPRGQVAGGVYWDGKARTLTLQNLVDLGDIGTNVVMSPSDFPNRPARRSDTNEPPPGFDPGRGPRSEPGREGGPPPPPPENEGGAAPAIQIAATESNLLSSNSAGTNGEPRRRSRRGDPERPFERPPWMSEADYQSILQKKGVHGFTIVMSTLSLIPPLVSDLWLRAVIVLLGTTALAAYALAWRNAARTSDLQIRLVRASELNSHLKEMNLAAAGLAHETRNPLNIVRGLAQMISRRDDSPPEIREKSRQILEETDRVTAQLNGFINYSRPRELHRAPTSLNSVASEVVRALNYDVE